MWPNPQETAGLVTITEEIVNGNIFCAVSDIGCGLHFQIYTEALAAWKVKSVKIRSYFWSVFFHIRTEYREILRISPYSVRMRENTDQK